MRGTATILAVLVAVAGCSSAGDQSQARSAINPESAAPAPGSVSARPDPVAAAIAYVASTDELMAHSPIGRAEIFRKLVVPGAVIAHVEAFQKAADDLATTLDVPVERLTWVESPLTATLAADSGSSATVDVWSVSVLGAPDAGSPQQVWRTVHVDLELTGGRWLVAAADADAGPTPAANELALPAGWADFEVVARWPAVVKGVGL
jgi:hypothetical protein